MIALARENKWRVAHFRPGRTKDGEWRTAVSGDGKGFPDLLLIRRGFLVVAELKVKGRKTTVEQDAWMIAFCRAGARDYLWMPDDWDLIVKVLS